jgi:pimeloyl-ACP methyl ester carboxylesterase
MYPERTTGLILLEAVSQSISNDGEISVLMSSDFLYWIMMSVMLGTGGPEALAASTVPDETNQQLILKDPGKLADLERIAWSLWPPSERLAGWRNDMEQMNELALPGQVRVPTLIIHGTKDADVPFDQSVNLADAIEGARLYAVEGGDHMMPISHREEVTSVIDDFLTSLVE